MLSWKKNTSDADNTTADLGIPSVSGNRRVFQLPSAINGLTDYILQHRSGSGPFLAAVIAKNEGLSHEEVGNFIRKVQEKGFKTKTMAKSNIKVQLSDISTVIPLSRFVDKVSKGHYLNVGVLGVVYVPLSGAYDPHVDAKIKIVDNRWDPQGVVAEAVFSTAVKNTITLPTDFCIPGDALSELQLVIEIPELLMRRGQKWGVLSMNGVITITDEPFQADLSQVTVEPHIPLSVLNKHKFNPRTFNAAFDDRDVSLLRGIREDMRDFSKPDMDKVRQIMGASTSKVGEVAMAGSDIGLEEGSASSQGSKRKKLIGAWERRTSTLREEMEMSPAGEGPSQAPHVRFSELADSRYSPPPASPEGYTYENVDSDSGDETPVPSVSPVQKNSLSLFA